MPPRSCTSIPVAMPTHSVANSTSARPIIFGSISAQAGSGVASMISCTLRSRSRHTSSPP